MTHQRSLLRPIILKCRRAQAKGKNVGGSPKYRPPRDELRIVCPFYPHMVGNYWEILITRETRPDPDFLTGIFRLHFSGEYGQK